MPAMQDVLAWLDDRKHEHLERLLAFLRFQTISAQSQHADDMRACAEWLAGQLNAAGVQAEILTTGGHPAVFAEAGPADAACTILVYGHYDVQPTGDESLWRSPPFDPTIRDGVLYARGAADDKGQLLTHLLAAEAWLTVTGALPIRVKYLIEGEEEIGSAHLHTLLETEKDRLACDYVVLSDTTKRDADTPALTCSTRGLVYKQIDVTGPARDLHSGLYGGIVANPLNTLATILASLRDAQGRITIPNFYDDVRALGRAERNALNEAGFDEAACLAETGSPALVGETGYTTLERLGVRPSLDVNGIQGGYVGEGASTVIPNRAFAKVSLRLAANQEPEKVSAAFDDAIRAACPPGVRLAIQTFSACPPYECPSDSAGARAAMAAMEQGYGIKPGVIRAGATLPILPLFRAVLGVDSLMMGFCVPDCGAHSANELFHIRDFEAGTRSTTILLAELARCVR